jgi:tellurite methyltransferase
MSQKDRRRWDEKWSDSAGEHYDPHPLLLQYRSLLSGGRALDMACGKGQNAIWLARQGYRVLGVDISPVALSMSRSEAVDQGLSNQLQFEAVDLDRWQLPALSYDLICIFRFLDRRHFPAIVAGLRPGGLLFCATRHVGLLHRCPEANKSFLLKRGELAEAFASLQVLHDLEKDEDAEFIARK